MQVSGSHGSLEKAGSLPGPRLELCNNRGDSLPRGGLGIIVMVMMMMMIKVLVSICSVKQMCLLYA